ncbi:MAG: carboxypeptidase-like regulatory domain-containing protein, partial [Algoriphagus sp.]
MREYKLTILYFAICLFGIPFYSQAQGIRGKVTTKEGEPLAYASVYIRNLEDGVPTNENGDYEFRLKSGYY